MSNVHESKIVASDSVMVQWALHYAARGWTTFPLDGETKISHTRRGEHGPERWGATKDDTTIRTRFAAYPDAGIGIPTGCENGFWVTETDTKNGKDGEGELAKLIAKHGPLPATYRTRSPSGSIHYYWQHPGPDYYITSSSNKVASGIDVKGDAGMVVAPPTARDGKRYEILDNLPIAFAPEWLRANVVRKITDEEKRTVRQAPPTDDPTVAPWEIVKLERWVGEALNRNPEWFAERENSLKTVWAIKRAGYGREGYRIAQMICNTSPETQRVPRVDRYWNDTGANKGTASLDTFWKMCHGVGIKDTSAELAEWRKVESDKTMRNMAAAVGAGLVTVESPPLAPSLPAGATPMIGRAVNWQPQAAPPEYSEIEVADRFANAYAPQLRYITKRKQWLVWNGKRWHADDTDYVGNLAKLHCKDEAALCAISPGNTNAQARALCSDKTIRAVLRIAAVDPRIASTVTAWDQDAWLLGTPDGVVELRTGVFRPARPEDHITKSTRVSPNGDCPMFLRFLKRATAENVDLQEYLQRLCGYILTGDTSEESLHFNYGPGGGGKGTFMHAIEAILGDYHTGTSIATLTEAKQERHLTEIASLQGARLVTCSETERGKRWAESRIKELTGRDTITARFMGGDPFNFIPTFKIQVSGNHKPSLRPDSAMRRRFQLVPFTAKIPESEKDTKLGEKLRAEWPAILAWMIAGCMKWQRDGLSPPEIVINATEQYMNEESEDCTAAWLAERCVSDPTATTLSAILYRSYKLYAEQSGEKPMSAVEFGKELRRMNYTVTKGRAGAIVAGLKLPPPPDGSSDEAQVPSPPPMVRS
jgi:putative DNA primase/helicase